MIHHLLDRISTWFAMINWQDTRVIAVFLGIELLAGGYLIYWAVGGLRRVEPDEEPEEQRPETDTLTDLDPIPDVEPTRFWARVRDRLFGPEPEGATEEATAFTNVARRGRVSGDMDSVVDRADWHDRLRDVAVRFEEALDVRLLEIAEQFGCYDEMLQALGATHVHIPDSVEIDDAAAPIMELLEADTMSWTEADQFALDELLSQEEPSHK